MLFSQLVFVSSVPSSQFLMPLHTNFLSIQFPEAHLNLFELEKLAKLLVYTLKKKFEKLQKMWIIRQKSESSRHLVSKHFWLILLVEVWFTWQHEKIIPPGQDFWPVSIKPYCWHPRTGHPFSWQLVSQQIAQVFFNLQTVTRSQLTNKYFISNKNRFTGEKRITDVNWLRTQRKLPKSHVHASNGNHERSIKKVLVPGSDSVDELPK